MDPDAVGTVCKPTLPLTCSNSPPRNMSTNTALPTREQYEAREMAEFRRQLADVDLEGGREFKEAMTKEPALVAQRVSWLLSGCYGWGSCHAAHDVLGNRRMNREAWMVSTIGALEWKSNPRTTFRNWRAMSWKEKRALGVAVRKVLASAVREVKENGRPA